MAEVSIEIEGLEEALKALDPAVVHKALRRFLERAAAKTLELVTKKAPVDTGRLQSSLTFNVDGSTPPLWAEVGTNVTKRGFSYPGFLDEGHGRNYRWTQWKGSPTEGWFGVTAKKAEGDISRYKERMQDELKAEMVGG